MFHNHAELPADSQPAKTMQPPQNGNPIGMSQK
jgi:hypothetical protein